MSVNVFSLPLNVFPLLYFIDFVSNERLRFPDLFNQYNKTVLSVQPIIDLLFPTLHFYFLSADNASNLISNVVSHWILN